jgi:TPR repeat protein
MTTRERELAAISRLRPRAMAGDWVAASNIAAGYRILGRWHLAFRWWQKAAAAGDGSDMLEVAYCYHHGLGVRRNLAAARRLYESAIRSSTISQFDQEEAMYHLAVLLLKARPTTAARARVERLLRHANADGDYPQASDLLASINAAALEICVCRRRLRPGLGRIACRLHQGALPNRALKRQNR